MDRHVDMTNLMVVSIIFRICLKVENCIYGQGGIIFFSDTSSKFQFRFILIINHTQECCLGFCLLSVLL